MIECDNTELDQCAHTFLEKVKKRKHAFHKSHEILENVNKLYLIDKQSHENMSFIAGKYILAAYSLDYLKKINELIEKKYSINQLSLSDFDNKEQIENIKRDISNVENEHFMVWLKDVCLEDLRQTCENIDIKDTKNLIKLGHIINLTLNEIKHEELKDIDLYDAHYRFQARLDYFKEKNNAPITTYEVYRSTVNEDVEVYFKKSVHIDFKPSGHNTPFVVKLPQNISKQNSKVSKISYRITEEYFIKTVDMDY